MTPGTRAVCLVSWLHGRGGRGIVQSWPESDSILSTIPWSTPTSVEAAIGAAKFAYNNYRDRLRRTKTFGRMVRAVTMLVLGLIFG